ncbi:hypothetical protein NL676_002412 [Syzygium grande]|nr:hypothetical protein NL676_002412 [Syzygium grande]
MDDTKTPKERKEKRRESPTNDRRRLCSNSTRTTTGDVTRTTSELRAKVRKVPGQHGSASRIPSYAGGQFRTFRRRASGSGITDAGGTPPALSRQRRWTTRANPLFKNPSGRFPHIVP